MILIRIELHSARTGKVTEIGRMKIVNDGGTDDRGNYRATTLTGRTRAQLDRGNWTRAGAVLDYPRKAVHVWHLVARALIAMNYAGSAVKRQPADLFDAEQLSDCQRPEGTQ
jgi:hypothetical protein